MKAGGIFSPVRQHAGRPAPFEAHQQAYSDGSLGTLSHAGSYQDGIFGGSRRTNLQSRFGSHLDAYRDGSLGGGPRPPQAPPFVPVSHPKQAPPPYIRKRQHGPKQAPPPMHGMGDVLSMDPATLAALQKCTDSCNAKYPLDPISLSICFASCDAQYTPTVTVPTPSGPVQVTPTPVSIPVPVPRLTIPTTAPAAPTPATTAAMTTPSAGASKFWLIAAGVAAVGAAGYLIYRKRKKEAVAG